MELINVFKYLNLLLEIFFQNKIVFKSNQIVLNKILKYQTFGIKKCDVLKICEKVQKIVKKVQTIDSLLSQQKISAIM